MYTFSQLLVRNSILGVIFCIVMTLVSLYNVSGHFEKHQNDTRRLVNTLATEVVANQGASELPNKLRQSLKFQQLHVSILSGEVLLNYTKGTQSAILSLVSPKQIQVTLKDQHVRIEYKLDYQDDLALVTSLLLIMFVTTALFILAAAIFSNRKYRRIFDSFSEQIKNEINLVKTQGYHEKTTKIADIVDIPELTKGLTEIHQLIEAQVQNSSALELEAYTEPLTGLQNRNAFVQFFENDVNHNDSVKLGVLMITRCSELQTINQIHGYSEGDSYIKGVAGIIQKTVNSHRKGRLFRLNSSDFAVFLANTTIKEGEEFARDLTMQFNDYQQQAELDSVAYTGLVAFDKNKPLGELLALADTAISVAQTQQLNAWYVQKDAEILKSASANYGNQNWRQEIDSVIENQSVTLLVQHIQPSTRSARVYSEILARFLNANDEMLPTASFIAMAEKLDRIVAVDKLIIDTAITELVNKNMLNNSFGINISARTIHDEQFLVWLERRLLRDPNASRKLVFEITEYGLQQNIRTSKRFIDMLHRVGARITVERFGVGLTSFKFFRDLKPDFIKMDATYTRDIDDDKNNQYFLRLMVDLAHRLSINVLAESVESQDEKHTLEKLFIDGCQGFYIGKPEPLSSK